MNNTRAINGEWLWFIFAYYFIPHERTGTSMATPHVAGVAALVWSHYPECTNKQIRNVLLASAQDQGSNGCDNTYGYGIVQAKVAFDLLATNGCDYYTSASDDGGCDQTWTGENGGGNPPPPPPPPPPPTGDCATGEMKIKITLNTDDYGEETEIKLKDSNKNTILSLGTQEELADNTQYILEECVPNDACRFIIKDSYGDGICCEYGNGSYTVEMNGAVVASGGEFGTREFKDFC